MAKRMTAGLTMLLVATAVAATAGSAQQREMPGQRPDSMGGMMGQGMMGQGMMGQGMMGQGMGMMATAGPGPMMILRMGDALELTDQQVSQLEAIQEELSATHQRHMEAAMPAQEAAGQALQGDSPDFDAYEEALDEASRHMVQAHVAMARAATRAGEVLTEEQRAQLDRGMSMMRGMMGQPGMDHMGPEGRDRPGRPR